MTDYTKLSDLELNRAVAERKGWTLYHCDHPNWWKTPNAKTPHDCVYKEWSTSIADAWTLLDEFKGGSGICNVSRTNDGWECELSRTPYEKDAVTCEAPTAPRAIAIAWLQAMEGKGNK